MNLSLSARARAVCGPLWRIAFAGVVGFWFAWFAFHPETGVYRFNEPNPGSTRR